MRSTHERSDSLLADIVAMFTLTITSLAFSIAIAVLVFGGALEPGLPRAIGSFVVGGGLMAIVVARRNGVVPVAIFVQESPAILMAVVAADFIARDDTDLADVFVLLVITMLAASLATGLLARFSLGGLGRYVPKSVVYASIGGMGWLLLKGGFDIMTSSNLGFTDIRSLLSLDLAKFWLPGSAIGMVAWITSRSERVPAYAAGLIVCLGIAGFYAVVALASSISAVESAGWLLGPFPESGGVKLVSPHEFRGANWSAIARTTPGILSVVVLNCISQMLNLTGIRCELAPQLDVDDELRLLARANLAAALLGMTPGFHGLGYTVVLNRLGATRRAVAIVAGGLTVVVGLVGVAAIGFVPRFIVGALLIVTGATLLEDWWRALRKTISRAEQFLGLVVIGAVMTVGLLQGIGLSVVIAAAFFVVRSSRVDPVKSASTGIASRSRVDRTPHERARLSEAGDRLIVIELHGYLSFGSLPSLEDRLRDAPAALDTLVIDFASVAAMDSSGGALLAQLLLELRANEVEVWVSALNPPLRSALLTSEPSLTTEIRFSSSLDDALESAEDMLLLSTFTETLEHRLQRNLGNLCPELLSHCTAHRFHPGTVVMAQGAPSDGLLIVQRGRATAYRVDADGSRTRLRSFGECTIAGGVGLMTNTPRNADLVAEDFVDGWWLSADRYHELRATTPQLVFELHEFIVRTRFGRSAHLRQVGHH